MRWVDIREIAIMLEEMHPDADNVNLRFTDLKEPTSRLLGISVSGNLGHTKVIGKLRNSTWRTTRIQQAAKELNRLPRGLLSLL